MGNKVVVRKFFGGLFFVIGWLTILLSGGCTIIFSLLSVGSGAPGDIGIVFFIGGIPFIFGLICVWLGRLIYGKKEN